MRAELRQAVVTRGRATPAGKASALVLAIALLAVAGAVRAAEVESTRLPDAQFRQGLLDLKLVELLDLHLTRNPPQDPRVELLLRRDMNLAVANDAESDAARRRAALQRADELLERLTVEYAQDERALEWRMTLANSRVFQQSEPFISNILYRGGRPEDRAVLGPLMERAADRLVELLAFLEAEYARLDDLEVGEYERLDESGYVARVEGALPQARHMLRWARFALALSTDAGSPQRAELLRGVLDDILANPALLTEEHGVSHLQAQSLLLAGMTSRLLDDSGSAARYLQDAVAAAQGLKDPEERTELEWLVLLGSIEQVRALRDGGRFEPAEQALARLTAIVSADHGDNFGLRYVTAQLAGSIARARSEQARRGGNAGLAGTLDKQAVEPLVALAAESERNRDEIYAALYDQLASDQQPEHLHPFQRCALIAGHLRQAQSLRQQAAALSPDQHAERSRTEARAIDLLDRGIALARTLIEGGTPSEGTYHCEALFNLGVALYQRGQRLDAAETLARCAEECPRYARAQAGAEYAVEIAAQLAADPSLRGRADVSAIHLRALRALVEGFKGAESTEYWRFFLAQALEEGGDLEAAARTYAAVVEKHPHYLVACFRAAVCQALAVKAWAAAHADQPREIKRMAGDAQRALEWFQALAERTAAAPADAGGGGAERLPRYLAETQTLLAELCVLPGVDAPQQALERLDGYEERFPGYGDLMARVLRTRIIAYESLGRIDEARQTVPRYLAGDPGSAAATVQALFDTTRAEIVRQRKAGRMDLATQKAQAALMLAEELYTWASAPGHNVPADGQHVLRLQLAEAVLESGDAARAAELFRTCADEDGRRHADGQARDSRVLMGWLEALFAGGKFSEALPLANRLYRDLPAGSPGRYQALLRDLQCRTELGQEPQGIIDAIRQHRYLDPDLGGAELKDQFADLQRRNEQRLAAPQ